MRAEALKRRITLNKK